MFAFFLAFVLSLSVFAALNLDYRKLAPYWHYLASLALIVILFFTYTRGAYVALAIFLFIVGLVRFRRFLLVACAVLLILFLAYAPIRNRAVSIVAFRSDDSISWRISLWKEAWGYAQPKVFSGYGLGTAPLVISNNKPYYYGSVEPHNDYLRILLEQGIIGLMAYILLLAGLVFALFRRYLVQNRPKLKMFNFFALAFSVPLFLMSFGDNILNDTALQVAFWALVGAILSVQPRKKEAR
jgi:O-antigen ligase